MHYNNDTACIICLCTWFIQVSESRIEHKSISMQIQFFYLLIVCQRILNLLVSIARRLLYFIPINILGSCLYAVYLSTSLCFYILSFFNLHKLKYYVLRQ